MQPRTNELNMTDKVMDDMPKSKTHFLLFLCVNISNNASADHFFVFMMTMKGSIH